jgi:trigger factor
MEHAINDLYRKAVEQEKIRPVGQPKIEIKKFVPYTALEFEVTQEVIGEVSLPNYKTMKLAKPKVDVTAEQVNNVLNDLKSRMAERKEVNRPSKDSDELLIDFSGKDTDGKPIAGTDGKDYPLVLGSGSFIPGFEEQLIGLKAGDNKEFDITFPKDYGVAAMQSKKVTFKVDVKKVNELASPKLDDVFAKKAGPFTSLSELKTDIKKQLSLEGETRAQQNYENELIGKIAEKTTVQLPKSMIDDQIEHMEAEEKRNLTYRGQTWHEHLEAEGLTAEQHRERQRPDAELRVKAGLVLSEIAAKEGLTVSDQEIDDRIAELKQQYQDAAMREELDKPESRNDLAARLLTEKTIAKLTQYASK